ncbi:MAG: hypothetical protein K2O65_04210, partial [Lachnospiraceae bacterium]|nr:hypothetical protein [Lachnospiraceae bacterium]
MRIKRMDRDFTVRQKADRKIHYAGQGKKYTENTANFSPKEKQDAVRQKNLPGTGTGIQAQRQSNPGRNIGNSGADNTVESYQQEYGNTVGGSNGRKNGNQAVFGNLHVKRPLQEYRTESITYGKHQQGQQIQRPSAYHENTIKTKESVLHRKADVPFSIKRADGFNLKEHTGKREKAQKSKSAGTFKAHRDNYAGEARQEKVSGNFLIENKEGNSDRRDEQISKYKRKKFFKSGKEKYSHLEAESENAGKKADTEKSVGTAKISEVYRMETQQPQTQGMGESA